MSTHSRCLFSKPLAFLDGVIEIGLRVGVAEPCSPFRHIAVIKAGMQWKGREPLPRHPALPCHRRGQPSLRILKHAHDQHERECSVLLGGWNGMYPAKRRPQAVKKRFPMFHTPNMWYC